MIPAHLIVKKRDGGPLTFEEWAAFLSGYRSGEVAEYQMAALLMAVYFQGMTDEETRSLTRLMIDSGERWDWSHLEGPVADKHSTGGVGDKVSLVLAPLVAACGVYVPMVSGRGLGHTGGTLDKIESIPGYRSDLDRDDYERLLREVGYAMGGQTGRFAPLDRELYALRDVTGTIESVPLITASIMSKKVAEGLDALVLDVKWGDGAFMRSREDAERLARSLIRIGAEFGLRAEALLTDMNAPLGRTVGHALEVRESIALLRGEESDPRLAEVVVELATRLLVATGAQPDEASARASVEDALTGGRALDRFRANVEAQGGDTRVIDDPARLPTAPVRRELVAPRAGWISRLLAHGVGEELIEIGGGRRVKGERIDPAVGFEFLHGMGARVEAGEPWCVVHARNDSDAEAARRRIESLLSWSDDPVEVPPVITARVSS
ncbi:MAG: thymidine phosphorylase [Gemmatimonadota bacterium]